MRDIYATQQFAEKKGFEKGRAEGVTEEKIETAKRLFAMGLSVEQVSQGSGLPIGKVQKIAKDNT